MNIRTVLRVFVITLVSRYKRAYGRILTSKKFKFVLDYIYNDIKLLQDEKYTTTTRLYWFIHNIREFPKCEYDHKDITKNVYYINYGYATVKNGHFFCSISCAQSYKETMDKIKKTILQRYGKDRTAIRQKTIATCMKRYGQTSPMKVDEVKRKCTSWFVDKEKVARRSRKTAETNMKKYGVKNVFQSQVIKEKAKRTKLLKYNDENYCNHEKRNSPYVYKNILFSSAPELAYYLWLSDHNIKFVYQPKDRKLKYVDKYGVHHTYYPDFLIVEKNQLEEIKGNCFFENKDPTKDMICMGDPSKNYVAHAKYECMKNNNVRMILYDEFKTYLAYVHDKYGKDFLNEHKKYNILHKSNHQ